MTLSFSRASHLSTHLGWVLNVSSGLPELPGARTLTKENANEKTKTPACLSDSPEAGGQTCLVPSFCDTI